MITFLARYLFEESSPMVTTLIFNLALNALIVIVLLLFSRQSLQRLRNIVNILSNGAYHDCPFYKESMQDGRRWYDKNLSENNNKGGESL